MSEKCDYCEDHAVTTICLCKEHHERVLRTLSLRLVLPAPYGSHIDNIITFIEAHKGDKFSFVMLNKSVPGRRATLYRILGRLRDLGFVDRTEKAFAVKQWWATDQWRKASPSAVKAAYENYMIVRTGGGGGMR